MSFIGVSDEIEETEETEETEENEYYQNKWSIEIDEGFKRNVDMLPEDLKKKLYIWCIRIFWRNYVPLTAKIPSWYEKKIKVERVLYDAREKNIHFMHLSFNTLPENKRWIMGCQCDYCKDYGKRGILGKIYLENEYKKLVLNPLYFDENMPLSGSSNWNYNFSENGVKYFDPFFDSKYEDIIIQAIRKNYPIYFLGTSLDFLDFTFEIE